MYLLFNIWHFARAVLHRIGMTHTNNPAPQDRSMSSAVPSHSPGGSGGCGGSVNNDYNTAWTEIDWDGMEQALAIERNPLAIQDAFDFTTATATATTTDLSEGPDVPILVGAGAP